MPKESANNALKRIFYTINVTKRRQSSTIYVIGKRVPCKTFNPAETFQWQQENQAATSAISQNDKKHSHKLQTLLPY